MWAARPQQNTWELCENERNRCETDNSLFNSTVVIKNIIEFNVPNSKGNIFVRVFKGRLHFFILFPIRSNPFLKNIDYTEVYKYLPYFYYGHNCHVQTLFCCCGERAILHYDSPVQVNLNNFSDLIVCMIDQQIIIFRNTRICMITMEKISFLFKQFDATYWPKCDKLDTLKLNIIW